MKAEDIVILLLVFVVFSMMMYRAFAEDDPLTRHVNCRINDCWHPEEDKGLIGDSGYGKLLEIVKMYQNHRCVAWTVAWHDVQPAKVKFIIFYTPKPFAQYKDVVNIHNNFRGEIKGMVMQQEDSFVIEQCDSRDIAPNIKASLWTFIQPKYHK